MELDDTIGTCTFLFRVDSGMTDPLSDVLRNQVRSSLLPAVEEVFSRRQFREYRVMADRMTLDLGKIVYDGESLRAVRHKLTDALEEELLRQIRGDSERSRDAAVLPSVDADVIMFMHYLQFGCFDRKVPLAPDKLFEELLGETPHLLVKYLRQYAGNENVLRRLAWQFDTVLLESLVAGLEPSEHKFMAECLRYLTKEQPVLHMMSEKTAEPDKGQYQRQVIEFVLHYVLVENTVQFNRANFVEGILRRIAGRYNIGFGKLLQVLITTVEATYVSEYQHVGLYGILKEIHAGMNGEKPSEHRKSELFEKEAKQFALHLKQGTGYKETRDLWDRLHRAEPVRFRSFMVLHCATDRQVRNMVRAFDEKRVQECIALLCPDGTVYIRQFSSTLDEERKNIRSVQRCTAQDGESGRVVDEFIIRYLMRTGEGAFSEKGFTGTLIKELANHYNISYIDLLGAVLEVMKSAEVKGMRMMRLRRVLQALWCEEPGVSTGTPPESGSDLNGVVTDDSEVPLSEAKEENPGMEKPVSDGRTMLPEESVSGNCVSVHNSTVSDEVTGGGEKNASSSGPKGDGTNEHPGGSGNSSFTESYRKLLMALECAKGGWVASDEVMRLIDTCIDGDPEQFAAVFLQTLADHPDIRAWVDETGLTGTGVSQLFLTEKIYGSINESEAEKLISLVQNVIGGSFTEVLRLFHALRSEPSSDIDIVGFCEREGYCLNSEDTLKIMALDEKLRGKGRQKREGRLYGRSLGSNHFALHDRIRQFFHSVADEMLAGKTITADSRETMRIAVRRFPVPAGKVLFQMKNGGAIAEAVAEECDVRGFGQLIHAISEALGKWIMPILNALFELCDCSRDGRNHQAEKVKVMLFALRYVLAHRNSSVDEMEFRWNINRLFEGTTFGEEVAKVVQPPGVLSYENWPVDESHESRLTVYQPGRRNELNVGDVCPDLEISGTEQSSVTKGLSGCDGKSDDPGVEYAIGNAGLAVGAAYFERLFSMLKFVDNKKPVDEQAMQRAIAVLQYFACGDGRYWEHELVFNKLLCGCDVTFPADLDIRLEDNEKSCVDSLVASIIKNWPKMKNASPAGLRQSFLKRDGSLIRSSDGWVLQVDPKPYDMLIDTLPWGMSIIKYPWMKNPVVVEWKWE